MGHDWASAHLHQAFSDYRMFKRIEDMDVEDSHKIYFLLKMSEKAALHYLTDGLQPPKKDHNSLLYFFKAARYEPLLRKRIQQKIRYSSLIKKIERIEEFAKELHRLVSVNQQLANCEYPWKDERGEIHVPAETEFPIFGPHNALLLRKYLRVFEMVFEANGLAVEQIA